MKGAAGYGALSQLAKLEANDAGASEGLLRGYDPDPDADIHVVDGSGMNLLIVERGRIITPDPERWNILRGFTMQFVCAELLDRMRMPWSYGDITPQRLLNADEVFLTGTATEVTPVTLIKTWVADGRGRHLDEFEIGRGVPGPITEQIASLYKDAVHGRIEQYQSNITLVEGVVISA